MTAYDEWMVSGALPMRLAERFGPWAGRGLQRLDCRFRRRLPAAHLRLADFKCRLKKSPHSLYRGLVDPIASAGLLLMSGCGAINDSFTSNACGILEIFNLAIRHKIPTAMVGRGLAPWKTRNCSAWPGACSRRYELLFLRDPHRSPRLLAHLGVDPSRVRITGDDAIELAYAERPPQTGQHLGVDLRLATYAGLAEPTFQVIGQILRDRAQAWGVKLLGLPIARGSSPSDGQILRRVFGTAKGALDDGRQLDTPLKVIRQTRECRVVVTASYHAGVFALSMGIPVVGLVASAYYRQKFEGLAAMFPRGCAVVQANHPNCEPEFSRHLDALWQESPRLRDALIAGAQSQVRKSQQAYQDLAMLVENPGFPKPSHHDPD